MTIIVYELNKYSQHSIESMFFCYLSCRVMTSRNHVMSLERIDLISGCARVGSNDSIMLIYGCAQDQKSGEEEEEDGNKITSSSVGRGCHHILHPERRCIAAVSFQRSHHSVYCHYSVFICFWVLVFFFFCFSAFFLPFHAILYRWMYRFFTVHCLRAN